MSEIHYVRLSESDFNGLVPLHCAYKAEIGEEAPSAFQLDSLLEAIKNGKILFFGAMDGEKPVGCCSVTTGFSTFDYAPSGVLEDFYILPGYRHQGIAKKLVSFAYEQSGVSSMTVGCADCDIGMYNALGFTLRLGNMYAYKQNSAENQ